MKTQDELAKTERALGVAVDAIKSISQGTCPGWLRTECYDAMEKITAILAPDPPEMEEVVESAGWVNIYPVTRPTATLKTRVSHAYPDKETADANAKNTRIDCQEIKIKVKRPVPQPVEVSVRGTVLNNWDITLNSHQPHPAPGSSVTVTWLEYPKEEK